MSATAARPRGVFRPPPLIGAVALAKLALLLACASAYGYYRGELYDLACANHLAWGYVDRPPFSIAFLLVFAKIYGETLLSVRVIPALLGTFVVIFTARLARRLGAGTLAQGLAALAVVVSPGLLWVDHVYSARSLEVLSWTLIAGFVARALTAEPEDSTRAWVLVGAASGIGLLNTFTTFVYVAALFIGVAVTAQRHVLKTRGPWLALGVATVVFSPYLAWQKGHGWPTCDFIIHALHAERAAASPLRFVVTQLEQLLPTNAVVWGVGLFALLRTHRFATYRPLGVAFVVTFVVFALLGDGHAATLMPAYPVLFAAGAAALEPWLSARRWGFPVLASVLFVSGAVCTPLAIPVLPVAKYEAYARALHVMKATDQGDAVALPERYADMFGWPELVRSVGVLVTELPPDQREDAVILANDSAQAGAFDVFGPSVSLPPVISGDGSYWRWGTAGASGSLVIAVGVDEAFLAKHFRAVELVTVFGHSLSAPSERHLRIYVCRDPVAPLDVMWPDFKSGA